MLNPKLLFQFIPLSLFLAVFRLTDNWGIAFEFGGSIAALQVLWVATMKRRSDLILLGVNAFLIIGALGFLGRVEPILNIYSHLRETTLFIAIFMVTLFFALFLKNSFSEPTQCTREHLNRCWLLFSVTVAASVLISFLGRGHIWLAGILPMILISIVKSKIQCWMVNSSNSALKPR